MSIDDFTESEARYRCLWLAVVLRAKQDAEGRNMMVEGNPSEGPEIVKEAREWLSTPSEELEWVAWAAGVEERELVKVGRSIREQSETGTRGPVVEPPFWGDTIRVRGEVKEGEHELRDEQFSSQLVGEGTDSRQLAGHDDEGQGSGGPEERHGEVEV